MKILHLSKHPNGGAGIACIRLHRALREAGIDSNVLVLEGKGIPEENIFSFETSSDANQFVSTLRKEKRKRYRRAWLVRFRGKPKELFSFPDSRWKIESHPLVQEADIIHLHWVAGMINLPGFFASVKKPIVWTLHDAWPFTGGFHYEDYFDGSAFAKISKRNLEIKKKAYAGKNITIVAPSRYLLNSSRESKVFEGKTHAVIPNSVPATIYHPLANRESIRKNLGVKEPEQLWVFACAELDYFRKGADILLKAFSEYENENVRLLIVGNPGKQVKPNDKRIQFTGHIEENKMVDLLNAADALLHTSREDNFPNIILESLFCGTPVLSTDEGGVPEMIHDGVNGFLTSAEKLPEDFRKILGKQFDRKKISAETQVVFSAEVQAMRFKQLYGEIFSLPTLP